MIKDLQQATKQKPQLQHWLGVIIGPTLQITEDTVTVFEKSRNSQFTQLRSEKQTGKYFLTGMKDYV